MSFSQWAPLARTVREWRATAAAYADLDLVEQLSSPVSGDLGAVPDPTEDRLMTVPKRGDRLAYRLPWTFGADALAELIGKLLREFTREDGGQLHCRNGAIHLAHEEIFDWIDETVLTDPQLARAQRGARPHAAHA